MASPLLTVNEGIALAMTQKKRVYVCLGTYSETLSLTNADDGLKVYGGLDCTNGWKYVGTPATGATVVATPGGTPAPATALTVTGAMTTGVGFQDVGFTSPDGVTAGDSSVVVFVTSGAKLSLTRGVVTAGKGIAQPTAGTNSNWPNTSTPAGTPMNGGTVGGAGGTNTCVDGTTSTGGSGGSFSSSNWQPGNNGLSVPAVSSPLINEGDGGGTCTPGTIGAMGAAPTQGGSGATSAGSLTLSGWSLGGTGSAGSRGNPGQGGGGGGGAAASIPGAGGGGGAGGCGGGSGAGASTGGSSFGVLAYQAALTLTNVTINTGAAGGGGTGGAGQAGQSGASGASEDTDCAGGPGASGTAGTGGGGGAGGHTIGIAWLGATGPTVNGTVVTADQATFTGITTGTKGAGGGGGKDGNGSPSGGPGSDGSTDAIQQFH